MIGILLIGSLRSPPPFRLCRTSPRESVSHDSQVALLPYESCSLAPHPGDRINCYMLSCRDMAPWLSIHSPTTKWGEGGGVSHQRGIAFPRPQGGCKGFRCPRQRHIKLPSEPARSVGRTHRSVRSTRTIEPERRRRLNPQARQGLSIRRVNLREYRKAPSSSRSRPRPKGACP